MKKIDYYIPLFKGNLYHIYNRANGKERIFFTRNNYFYFLRQYYKYISNLSDTFAFCLLPNHFHLLVRPKINAPEIISEQFRRFFISYSMSINKQEKRKGNLFQRGFKRKIIDNQKYFYSAVYYIHANPVYHGILKEFIGYDYSSYNLLLQKDNKKLCCEEVIDWFGGRQNYIDFHKKAYNKNLSDNYLIED